MGNKIKIVDSTGKPINVDDTNKVKKIKKYIGDNIWNILGIGISTCITLGSLINIFVSANYSRDCSEYYGIDEKYFNGSLIFQNKMIFLVATIILLVYPFIFNYINLKLKSKVYVLLSFLVTVYLLFMQNLTYTVNFIDSVKCEWLITIIDNNVTIIVFLISDIVLAYFFILRNYLKKDKPVMKLGKIVFALVLGIYLFDTSIGVTLALNRQISDKKFYEVIDNNKVVITTYEGRFLVMDCDVQGEILYIEKGKYSFIEITGVDIEYHEYEDVQCE